MVKTRLISCKKSRGQCSSTELSSSRSMDLVMTTTKVVRPNTKCSEKPSKERMISEREKETKSSRRQQLPGTPLRLKRHRRRPTLEKISSFHSSPRNWLNLH